MIVERAICGDINSAHGATGGQLAAWLRVRYPDIIAGAISSSPTFLGAPGLGLVSHYARLSVLHSTACCVVTQCVVAMLPHCL